jgi:hypothetical protein
MISDFGDGRFTLYVRNTGTAYLGSLHRLILTSSRPIRLPTYSSRAWLLRTPAKFRADAKHRGQLIFVRAASVILGKNETVNPVIEARDQISFRPRMRGARGC